MSECPSCHRHAPPDSETGYDANDFCPDCQHREDLNNELCEDDGRRKTLAEAWAEEDDARHEAGMDDEDDEL